MNTTAGKSWYIAHDRRTKYKHANTWHGLAGGPRSESGPGINRCRLTLAYARLEKVLPGVSYRSAGKFLNTLYYL